MNRSVFVFPVETIAAKNLLQRSLNYVQPKYLDKEQKISDTATRKTKANLETLANCFGKNLSFL